MTRASNAGTLDRNFVLPALCGTSDDADVSHDRRAGPLARGRGDGIVPAPWVACALTQHEFRATVGGPLVAMNRHPVARNRSPLYPQKRTFRGPRWTSVVDPKPTYIALDAWLNKGQF